MRRTVVGVLVAKLSAILIVLFPLFQPPEANRCFAILIFTLIMLTASAWPLFVTTLMVPVMAVLSRILLEGDRPLPAPQAAHRLLEVMFGPMIPVLLAAFSLAAAVRKYHLITILSRGFLAKREGAPPWLSILALMLSTAVLCLALPNVSAVLIAYALIVDDDVTEAGRGAEAEEGPSDEESQTSSSVKETTPGSDLLRAKLLGIAMAGSIGGFLTPISSPQSVFAYTLASVNLRLTWSKWLAASLPCALLALLGGWLIICLTYNLLPAAARDGESRADPECDKVETCQQSNLNARFPPLGAANHSADATTKHRPLWVALITLGTIVLWTVSSWLSFWLGGMAIVSFIPLIILYGSGLLTSADLSQHLPWDIILFEMGSLALVEATQASGLLNALAKSASSTLAPLGSWWAIIALTNLLVFLISTSNSHTVAGLLFAPLALAILRQTSLSTSVFGPSDHNLALYVTGAFCTSIGMAFPFSGLVNVAMYGARDTQGRRVLGLGDFLRVGLPLSILSYGIITGLGTVILYKL